MLVYKVAPVFLFIIVVGAEKKIELQDIEEDNLKSEKEKELEKSEARTQTSAGQGLLPFEFLKNGFLRYFENPTHSQAAPQQQRYVSQYAVTEPPESPPPSVQPKVQYGPPAAQQAMVGYLSNVPMQIYLVPQYFNDQHEQTASAQQQQYLNAARLTGYASAPEAVQSQTNYVEVPSYVAPTGKTYVQQYTSPVAYVYTQPTVAPATVAPVVTYQVPVMQYPTAIAAPPVVNKAYYQTSQFEGNTVEEQENEEVKYTSATEVPYTKATPEFPRYYSSQAPIREQYRPGTVSELPPPNPLILKPQPSHLAHLPKALPFYRPLTKSVYSGSHLASAYSSRPFEAYGPPYKRRPTSLLDSYIPSGVQLEYMKRGFTKDPLLAYEELSSGRHLSQSPSSLSPVAHSHSSITHSPVIPRHYERGFLPNQMYHTAAGGVTFGHYKRTPKIENKASKN